MITVNVNNLSLQPCTSRKVTNVMMVRGIHLHLLKNVYFFVFISSIVAHFSYLNWRKECLNRVTGIICPVKLF